MCISFMWREKAGNAYGFSLVLWQHGTCAQIMGWQTSVHFVVREQGQEGH